MFAAGMHYWQLGDSPYWGHNAVIRVEPFMQYCGLPRLAGKPPFGGDIMSHDFVEAALLGRARWSIWLAFDLPGSWEETPGSLLEEMQRDRRWCQGNLQHLRLLFTAVLRRPPGAVPERRLAYGSACSGSIPRRAPARW
jgi:membrane glycosyltransferase